jgi:ABC-type bacteriocin/lantibiotic exporter with double-glycine peptidase domain
MKASRAAIKAANNLAELAEQIVLMQVQLNRIEEILTPPKEEKQPAEEKVKAGK